MTRLKTPADIEQIRASADILKESMAAMRAAVRPGITTQQLNDIAAERIAARGARPSFLGYLDYPASICISINEEVIHGIPGKRQLIDGDLVSLDLGIDLNGYFSDAACTMAVGTITPELQALLRVTEECLRLAVEQAVAGNRVKDISRAVFEHADGAGYGIVRQYCGHGVGFGVHEEPQVPNYPGDGENPRLKAGMVLALEPMLNLGAGDVDVLEDGWTVVTTDGSPSAHFEHTVAILEDRTEVLTALD